MNPQRLVAAIAALAIGFGVTLVGVGFTDDGTVADDAGQFDDEFDDEFDGEFDGESDPESDAESDSDEAPSDAAEQEEEPADEPVAAEVEEPDSPTDVPPSEPSEPSVQQGQPQEGVPAEPVATSAPNPPPPGAPDAFPDETGEERSFPDFGSECVPVLRLEYVRGVETVVLIGDLGNRRVVILDSEGEADIDLDDEDGLEGFAIGTRQVEFEGGRPVEYGDFCDLADGEPGGAIGTDAGAPIPGTEFPCSDRAFEEFSRPLSNLERTELLDDRDVFLTVIAKRLAALGSTEDAWLDALEREFDSFADVPDGCPENIETALATGSVEFFCAASQISNDPDLFVFFRGQVDQAMVGCTFENESAQGGN